MKFSQLLFIFLLFVAHTVVAQTSKNSLLYSFVQQKQATGSQVAKPVLFKQSTTPVQNELAQVVKNSNRLVVDKSAALKLYMGKPLRLVLAIPYDATTIYNLQLVQQSINDFDDFAFGTITGKGERIKSGLSQGLHYRGYIDGDPTSIAAISLFNDGTLMGIFSGKQGNFVIGKTQLMDGYMVYNSDDLLVSSQFECATKDVPLTGLEYTAPPLQNAPATLCKKVRFYWEGDYELYSYNFNSNLTDTRNYLAGVFNQVATIFQNEGIEVELGEAYVWTSADPYRSNSSANGLADFKAYWNSLGDTFNGDLAHLVAGKTNNGGLAYILANDFCNRAYAYGYSNVYAQYNTVPTYSWDVQVLSHEIGHNMGSNHTHWCGWKTGANGACGAIDNCYPTESLSSGCGTCGSTTDIANLPAGWQGTIMSYCYLKTNIGVNFSQGFGPLPQAAMRANIAAAACPILSNRWSGAVSTAWENTANWSCGSIPDANTDVTIAAGLTNYPVVNSAAVCRRLKQATGSNVKISTGKTLNVAGK